MNIKKTRISLGVNFNPCLVPVFLIAILFGFLQLNEYISVNYYNFKRAAQLTFLFFLVVIYCSSGKVFQQIAALYKQKKFLVCVFLFFGGGGASIAFEGKNVNFYLLDVLHYFFLFHAVLVLSVFIRSDFERFARYFAFCLLVFLFLVALGFWSQYLSMILAGDRPAKNYYILVSGFTNVRFLNQVQVLSMPLLFYASISGSFSPFLDRLRFARFALLFTMVSHCVILTAFESRGAILSLVIAFVFAMFIVRDRKNDLLRSAGRVVVISSILFAVCFIFIPNLFVEIPEDTNLSNLRLTSTGRKMIWGEYLSQWANHFPLGSSPGAGIFFTKLRASHPHNFYIQLFTEWGLIPALIGIYALWSCIRNVRTSCHVLAIYQISFLAACVYACFSGVFVMPLSQTLLVYILAVIVSQTVHDVNGSGNASLGRQICLKLITRSAASAIFAVYAILGSTWLLSYDISLEDESRTPWPRYVLGSNKGQPDFLEFLK